MEPGTAKYLNLLGLLGLLLALVYVSPFSGTLPDFVSNSPLLAGLYKRETTPSTGLTREQMVEKYKNGCPAHQYESVKILSRAPDMMVIQGFLTKDEANYLVQFAEPILEDSRTVDYVSEDGSNEVDKTHRDSQSAYIDYDPTDEYSVLRCVEERAAEFQGHIPIENMENLQVVKYGKGHFFREHYDYFDPEKDKTLEGSGNRATSFFVYLVADCEGGTTRFPNVPRPKQPEWCDLLRCQDETGKEINYVDVKATVGTAVFWHNFATSGELDDKTLHAGTDVLNGTKYGLNIWTRERKYRR